MAGWFGLVRFGSGFLNGWVVGLHGGGVMVEAVTKGDLFDAGVPFCVLMMDVWEFFLFPKAVIVDCAC